MNEYQELAIRALNQMRGNNVVTIGIRGEGFEICNECWSRIIRRGCSMPRPNQILWSDQDEVPNCDLKEFH